MTDDDKTGRHNWASKVPLMTLLAIVFAAGGLLVKQQFVEVKVDKMIDKWDRYATASEARHRAMEDWKIVVETKEAAAQKAAREQERSERKKQR
jgi:hypothetical protein